MAIRVGVGNYQYEVAEGWGEWPVDGVASDVATDSQGRVYVAVRTQKPGDDATGAIVVFNRDGKHIDSWGEDIFNGCHGLWISPKDEVYHTDAGDNTVTKFTTDGQLLMTIGTKGEWGEPGMPFSSPTRAVESSGGDIYVSDGYGQNRCHKFTPDGELVFSWGEGDNVYWQEEVDNKVTGTAGTGPGQFNLPHDIAVDRNDLSYVADRENLRCQVFDPEGNYITEWNNIKWPNDAVIVDDVMYIAEGGVAAGAEGVLIMKLNGEVIGRWGEIGDRPGQWRGAPHGIWVDCFGDLYVAEVGAQQALHKFVRV
jgi:DNA-binding beta-propeller fold protein YncE